MSRVVEITTEEKNKILTFAKKAMDDANNNKASQWKLRRGYSIKSLCIGMIGELAYSKMTKQKIDLTIKPKGDGGIDFPDGAQVKTVTYSGPYQKKLKIDNLKPSIVPKKYILAYYEADKRSNYVTLIGEISYDNFINRKNFDKKFNCFTVNENSLDRYY